MTFAAESSYMATRSVRHGDVLSVRVGPEDRATLRELMREEGLDTESEATRMLIARARRRREAEAIVARLRRRPARGHRVRASEEHDRILPGTRH